MPPPRRRPPASYPASTRCKYVARNGARCKRVATIDGELCQSCAKRLAAELGDGATSLIDDVASGRVAIGDVISGAVSGYLESLFGKSPWLRDLDQAAARAQTRARASRPGSSAAGSSPRPSPGPGPRHPPPRPPSPQAELARQLLKARETLHFEPKELLSESQISDRRKQLAKVFHPDRPGGSTAATQRMNAAADLLIAQLGRR